MTDEVVELFRNQWVAVDEDGVVFAHNFDFEDLHTDLRSRPHGRVIISRIPALDEPMFVGLA